MSSDKGTQVYTQTRRDKVKQQLKNTGDAIPGTKIIKAASNLTWDHLKVAGLLSWSIVSIAVAMVLMAVDMTTALRALLVIWTVATVFITPIILYFSVK